MGARAPMKLFALTVSEHDGIDAALQSLIKQGWISEPAWERWDTYISVTYRWEWPGSYDAAQQCLASWLPSGTHIELGVR